jgi:hypothetical protein
VIWFELFESDWEVVLTVFEDGVSWLSPSLDATLSAFVLVARGGIRLFGGFTGVPGAELGAPPAAAAASAAA